MRSAKAVRKEHKAVVEKMAELEQQGKKAGYMCCLPKDEELYFRFYSMKMTLEWVHPNLIKTTLKGPERFTELMGYRHVAAGPLFATLYP